MEQINSYYKKKIVDISGNICNAIEYYDGTQFIEPFFDGETVGWVRDVFINHTKRAVRFSLYPQTSRIYG